MATEGPQDNAAERGFENILTRQEILSAISTYCENPTIIKELRDKDGVYLLEVKGVRKIERDSAEYIYQRKGDFPNGSKSSVTSIMVVPQLGWPEIVSEYDAVTKKWIV
ncbi:hypothetical protein EPO14_01555 [Patescibacteria group bacterium]|nr:MAG: hypothetical protein EPO14_01555 [Patescibacteria group bacterium]